jgi:mono/diheme cytochrome c family protein
MIMSIKKKFGLSALFLGLSSVAVAFPWDIDMVDSYFIRGYEKPMTPLPEEAVSQNNYRPTGYENLSPEDQAQNDIIKIMKATPNMPVPDPFVGQEKDAAVLAQGKVAFTTYCQTCHGYKGSGKTKNLDAWKLQSKFVGIPNIHILDGKNNIAAYGAGAIKPKEELYLIIRNGRNKMPSYGHAMSEAEIWSAIHYIKSLPGTNINDGEK